MSVCAAMVAMMGFIMAGAVASTAAAATTYTASWPSLDSRPNPAWYEQSRFGIKIHWGLYAVPGFGALGQYAEQYARFYRVGTEGCGTAANPIRDGCKTAEFHNRVFGKDVKYERFAAQFNPVLYDADQWADVFRRGGAQYVYMTAKHSDGFAMWPSVHRKGYNSMDTIGRDLLGELMTSVAAAGLKPGIFYEIEDYCKQSASHATQVSVSP
jgi:alpha-L-fucosidase